MSLRRTCDCPETYCHAAEDYYLGKDESYFLDEGGYQTIGNFDVCLVCLDGCMHWQPYALEAKFVPKEPQITELVKKVYDSYIQEALLTPKLLKKMEGMSESPMVTFKLMKDQSEEE